MSTRSLVRFATREEGVSFSEHPERVEVQIYKHYDGYPSGHPVDLAEFSKGSLYNYFKNKEDLFLTTLEVGITKLRKHKPLLTPKNGERS